MFLRLRVSLLLLFWMSAEGRTSPRLVLAQNGIKATRPSICYLTIYIDLQYRLNDEMVFPKSLPLPKISWHRSRSETRSENSPIEGQSEADLATPRPTESIPGLRDPHQPNMKFPKFLPLPKVSWHRSRSETRSEISPIEGQSEADPATPHPTESTPDLRDLHRPNMKLPKFLHRSRSKARSEISPIEGQSEADPAIPRPTESTPDLRIGTSTLPTFSTLAPRDQESNSM